jgi:hypothetical protein
MQHIQTEGTFINAGISPEQRINCDYKRIYYCKTVRAPSEELIAYFERKFAAPAIPK